MHETKRQRPYFVILLLSLIIFSIVINFAFIEKGETAHAAKKTPANYFSTVGTSDLGSNITLTTSDINYYGYQFFGTPDVHLEIATWNGGVGNDGQSGVNDREVLLYGKIPLSAQMVDLRQKGVLSVTLSGVFGRPAIKTAEAWV